MYTSYVKDSAWRSVMFQVLRSAMSIPKNPWPRKLFRLPDSPAYANRNAGVFEPGRREPTPAEVAAAAKAFGLPDTVVICGEGNHKRVQKIKGARKRKMVNDVKIEEESKEC